jgi:murein DD-endopeptidase MepM/ murein hydrolase activator NlpD
MQAPAKKRRGHYGIDVIPSTSNRKAVPLKAVEDGTVVVSSRARGYGYYVVLYHQNGLFSLYSHAVKKNRAGVGKKVERGETIAYMGKSGNARGYHLHFELIDLRDFWEFEEDIDKFVQHIADGKKVPSCQREEFKTLLFAKKSKQDPLQSIPGLSFAERINGKWVATQAIIPANTTNLAEQ